MDSKGRQLQRLAASGDAEAGLRLASHAARTNQPELLAEGVITGISLLGISDLRKLQYAIGKECARKLSYEEGAPKRAYEKAVEFASSALGKVSLGEFVAAIEDFVTECSNSDVSDSEYLYCSSYGPRKKACAQKASEVLNRYMGNFAISSSSPIRIYAVKEEPSPEEKEIRRKAREKIKIEQELENQKATRNKLVKQLEKQKRREARLKKKLEEIEGKLEAK